MFVVVWWSEDGALTQKKFSSLSEAKVHAVKLREAGLLVVRIY